MSAATHPRVANRSRECAIETRTKGKKAVHARWIEPNPHKPDPAEAWVLPHRVSVWALIRQLELDSWQVDTVAEGFELPPEAVEAAITYYRRHKPAVEARIEHNRRFFGQ